MTERKFADEEVIKALEWCIQNSDCEYCEYREKTDKSDICPIRMDALNLINKQNAEIETLKDNNEHLAVMLEEAKSEVERLKVEKDALIKNYAECMKDYASEIFAELEKVLQNEIKQYDDLFHETEDPRFKQEYICANNALEWASIKIIELKKKYTEGEQ